MRAQALEFTQVEEERNTSQGCAQCAKHTKINFHLPIFTACKQRHQHRCNDAREYLCNRHYEQNLRFIQVQRSLYCTAFCGSRYVELFSGNDFLVMSAAKLRILFYIVPTFRTFFALPFNFNISTRSSTSGLQPLMVRVLGMVCSFLWV